MSIGPGDQPSKFRKITFIQNWLGNTDLEARGVSDVDEIVSQIDLQAEVDNSLSASENWEIIKERHGLLTRGEVGEMMSAMADAAEQAFLDQIREEINRQFDEYGFETVVDALNEEPFVPDDIQEEVFAVLTEVPPDMYDAVLRDRIGAVLEALGNDLQIVRTDRLESLREDAMVGRDAPENVREARRELLTRLESGFGQRFESIDDAIRRLQERIERARGERLTIAPIEIRRSGDEILIRVEDGGEFDKFRQPARQRIVNELDLSELGRTWTTVGEVRLRGDDLEALDLEIGRERLGSTSAPQPLEIEQRELAQTELEDVTANAIADRFLELSEGES